MNSVIQQKHKELIELIYAYDYYVRIFNQVKEKCPVDENDANSVTSFWNDFWFALPYSPAIHRPPFNQICDIAEGNYLNEQSYETEDLKPF